MNQVAEYFKLLDILDTQSGPDFLRETPCLNISGKRGNGGQFDVRIACAIQSIGLSFPTGVVGPPQSVPHRTSDDIKDKIASEGWYSGAPTLYQLAAMDKAESQSNTGEIVIEAEIEIETKPIKPKKAERSSEQILSMITDYRDNLLTLQEVADKNGTTLVIVKRILIKSGVKIRKRGFRRPQIQAVDVQPPSHYGLY